MRGYNGNFKSEHFLVSLPRNFNLQNKAKINLLSLDKDFDTYLAYRGRESKIKVSSNGIRVIFTIFKENYADKKALLPVRLPT